MTMMKTTLLVASTAALLAGGFAIAAPHGAKDPAQRAEAMAERLDLTSEQQQQIEAILEANEETRAQARQALRAEIDAVLTEEQREVRNARVAERAEHRLTRMSERLDLSNEQTEQLQALYEAQADAPKLTRSEMREQLAEVLTEDQLAQLDQGRDRRAGKHDRRHGDCDSK
jgi:protein CpxP